MIYELRMLAVALLLDLALAIVPREREETLAAAVCGFLLDDLRRPTPWAKPQ